MKYTKDRIIQKIKGELGHPFVKLEIDNDGIEDTIEDALDTYSEYFTNWRYVVLNVSSTGKTYTIPVEIEAEESDPITEILGTILDGTTSIVLSNLSSLPIKLGSVTVTIDTITGTDNSQGNLSGTGIAEGSIDYETGHITLTLTAAVTGDKSVSVEYTQIEREALPVSNVMDVQRVSPSTVTNFITRRGIYDGVGIKITDLMSTGWNYQLAVQSIEDSNNTFGATLNWEYYRDQRKLYLDSFFDGTAAVKVVVPSRIEDIDNDHTRDFVKLCTAYAKIRVGRVRSKHKNVPIPGGTLSLDGEDLVAEAAIDEERIRERWSGKQNSNFIHVA